VKCGLAALSEQSPPLDAMLLALRLRALARPPWLRCNTQASDLRYFPRSRRSLLRKMNLFRGERRQSHNFIFSEVIRRRATNAASARSRDGS
jgi:hypothetical protein